MKVTGSMTLLAVLLLMLGTAGAQLECELFGCDTGDTSGDTPDDSQTGDAEESEEEPVVEPSDDQPPVDVSGAHGLPYPASDRAVEASADGLAKANPSGLAKANEVLESRSAVGASRAGR